MRISIVTFAAATSLLLSGSLFAQDVKNVQILKGMQREEIYATMGFVAASLGVTCDFCHVRTEKGLQYELDDKKEKRTARKMMLMMKAIDDQNFDGRQRVTCATCHNGQQQPRAVSPIVDLATVQERIAARQPKPPVLPAAADLLARYEQAIGGTDTIAKLNTIDEKYVSTNGNGPEVPGETLRKAPGKWRQVTNVGPDRTIVWVCDGNEARIVAPGHYEVVRGADLDDVKFTADFWRTLRLADRYSTVSTTGAQKLNGHDGYTVRGQVKGSHVEEELVLDAASGLLLRRTTFKPTALGFFADRVDFDDYRSVDGIKVAYVLRIATGQNVSTRTLTEVRFNVPIDDAVFAMPPAQ
jgi:photosynthetic reaction center cytochrome c subunit